MLNEIHCLPVYLAYWNQSQQLLLVKDDLYERKSPYFCQKFVSSSLLAIADQTLKIPALIITVS